MALTRLISHITANAKNDEKPSWSPTAGKIAFYSTQSGSGDIWTMDADGSGETNITNYLYGDNEPSWSPDGSKLVFQSYRDGYTGLWSMNADGSSVTRIYIGAALEPNWGS